MGHGRDYWDGVGAEWRTARPQRLWREYTDGLQLALIGRWGGLSPTSAGGQAADAGGAILLKTDLFDEVTGRGLVPRLLAAGASVTGIDISPFIAAEAAARSPGLTAVAADVRSLPFPDGSFDMVFSGSTLDHFDSVSDIRAALDELGRVLRLGGRLILTMDNPANPLIRLRNGPLLAVLRRVGIVPYHVGVTLGPQALAAAVRDAGFEVTEVTAVMHCPRVIAVRAAAFVAWLPDTCRRAFLRCLSACEWLESMPSRWLTGHYVAIHALRRERCPREAGQVTSTTVASPGPP